MPNNAEHCEDSLRRYGKPFSELHKWMDEPSTILGASHRKYRHDPNTTPKEAKALFGENADNACLDHIRLDELERRKYPTDEGKEEISTKEGISDRVVFLSSSIFCLVVGIIFINFIVQLALPCLACSVFFFFTFITFQISLRNKRRRAVFIAIMILVGVLGGLIISNYGYSVGYVGYSTLGELFFFMMIMLAGAVAIVHFIRRGNK
jgi:hypothetical protein